ncbi:DUF1214 domain-containing protein [Gilvimarinus xylanilyticus]|uniref:DUF1214 domain-containing protein n=1 Tax=Gilvimarinus xylanilyticus TaxID=2944139 RepID=A0A9X2I0G5_9GAMM|nr:DUF1214 domain-containing protein [Gilvimarinus xylanilyticus]MCP8897936.1 DUF1214 domain-containing protein [Gilvimarinus xylanilyticus]
MKKISLLFAAPMALAVAVHTHADIAPGYDVTTPADFGVSDYVYKVSESDFNFKRSLAKAPINEWAYQSDLSRVKTQQVIRENQDGIYASAVVDVSEGATFTIPEGDHYQIIQVIDMQNYVAAVAYAGDSITVTPEDLTYGNHVYLNMRVPILTEDKGGIKETLRLQRAATIEANSAKPYVSPDFVLPLEKTEEIRAALVKDVKGGALTHTRYVNGTPYSSRPQDHLYGTAYGWGGLGLPDAAYWPFANKSKMVDGKMQPASATFTPPDIQEERGGFWSVTIYNEEGWLAKDISAISNTQAEPNADGTYTIHFNSPGEKNNLETSAPFAALFRFYLPDSKESAVQYINDHGSELVIE